VEDLEEDARAEDLMLSYVSGDKSKVCRRTAWETLQQQQRRQQQWQQQQQGSSGRCSRLQQQQHSQRNSTPSRHAG
jgi:hypothetical protein